VTRAVTEPPATQATAARPVLAPTPFHRVSRPEGGSEIALPAMSLRAELHRLAAPASLEFPIPQLISVTAEQDEALQGFQQRILAASG